MDSTAIKSIRDSEGCTPDSRVSCAYFFFDSRSGETDQSLHHKMLRSLIRQMSYQAGSIPAALVQLYGGGHETPSLTSLQKTLHQIIAGFERAYIVIDALDECTDREKVLAWTQDLLRQNMSQLHILFSSRREQDIVRCLEPIASIAHVSLAGASTNADIETYVDAMLAKVTSWDTKTRARVKSALMEGADGMFRWVALQIAELSKCLTRRAVDEQLRSLPKDLDGMYERSLSRSANQHELKQLLIWLAFSVRHLLVEELAEVIAIDFSLKDTPAYDPDLRYFSPTDVLDLCAGFVTCVPISADPVWHSSIQDQGARIGSKGRVHRKDIYIHSREATDLGTVKLAHMSVKDYLVSERIKNGAAFFFAVDAILAHNMITATCLAYLMHLGRQSSFDEATSDHFPLVLYAARNWPLHARMGRIDKAPVWQLMICMFSRGHNALINCIRMQEPHRRDRWNMRFHSPVKEIAGTPPLYYASLFGLQELVKEILSHGEDVQVRGGPCGNALQAASYHGHGGVVQILLEHGANVNTHGGKHSNALRAAFYGGHINVARLLLEHDADVTAHEQHEGTLLQEATGHDDFATVQLLLEHGVDANASAGPKGTALQIASGRGEIDIVRLLLEHGAAVNTPAGPKGTALQAVINWSYSEDLLLDYERQNMDTTGLTRIPMVRRFPRLMGRTDLKSLALEASHRRRAIVRLLLEHGADANAPPESDGEPLPSDLDWYNATALQIAAHGGKTDIVRVLLEYGADVNAPAGPDGTVLQHAARHGHLNTIQLLLEHGADVNAPAGATGTALQVANEPEVVRLLIENGADANAPRRIYDSALLYASEMGQKTNVLLLLERGATMNSWEAEIFIYNYSSAKPNHAEILQLLLDNEAAVDMEWLYRKRVEWFREGRFEAEDYDSIEHWRDDIWGRASDGEQDSDGEQWYTPDEGSAPASPVQNTL
ncbi:hypothetical protein HWV62_13605 [Athelia sp. TMB]|nr:hypothetical protein HWV62_13605 [Athelia sp. TMB]